MRGDVHPGGQQGSNLLWGRQGPSLPRESALRSPPGFVAIDFETADRWPDSACAVGLVRVEGLQIVAREVRLIRPPRKTFENASIHGIAWDDVACKPTFGQIWPELKEFLQGAAFLAAHNARFDQGVLRACCAGAGVAPPDLSFVCTVQLARRTWGIYPTRLPDVCRRLGIPLHHHKALSDAEACARIVVRARSEGKAVHTEALPAPAAGLLAPLTGSSWERGAHAGAGVRRRRPQARRRA